MAAIYNLKTGAPVMALTLTTAPAFINDVIVTRDAAYFTNSFTPELYRVPVSRSGEVGTPETIALSGPAANFVAGFNLNGIEATANGRTLISINSATGKLFTIDAMTGESALIDVGGMTFPTGDGILLQGRTLYVLQNGNPPGGDQSDRRIKFVATTPRVAWSTPSPARSSRLRPPWLARATCWSL